jgi:trehalose-6-phosphatase
MQTTMATNQSSSVKPTQSTSTMPGKEFVEKFIAPKKPKGAVYCYVQDKYRDREAFIQVIFTNPQDSDMIRVPHRFGGLGVKVKTAEKRDLDMLDCWRKQCELNAKKVSS